MQREIEPEAIYSKTNNKEIIMQRENKWQDRFEHIGEGRVRFIATRSEVRDFIQSEIDRAVAERDKEIVGIIEQMETTKCYFGSSDKYLLKSDIINNIK